MFRRDRKKGGRGIMVYIRKSIPSHRIRVKSNEVEAILIDIQLGQQYMSLLCAYKPPAVTNNTVTNEMYALLDSAITNRSNVMCLGDLNCDTLHSLDGGKEGRTWLDICDIYDLVNLITEPTRICKTKESCLDIIATNAPSSIWITIRDNRGRLEWSQTDLHCFEYKGNEAENWVIPRVI